MQSILSARRKACQAFLLVLFVAAVISGPWPARAISVIPGEEVTIADGLLRGNVRLDHREFLGVPYAAPPTGGLRFRPPEPPTAWSGERDAREEGSICPQSSLISTASEDCLMLDIRTPPLAESKNLPVMVWFHGGGYLSGSGAGYDPTPLVTKGKVIVVTVNYRLGPFGFLALPELDAESHTAGNNGILDQQASLRWVKKNIGAFGGNPGNVTIFGQSAGGHSGCMHLISPTAAGLFQKVISESGGCINTPIGPATLTQAYAKGKEFATAVGCTDAAATVACLRGKSMSDLLNAPSSGSIYETGLTWWPTIDGTVIKETPAEALASGRYNHVPLIAGSTKNEGTLFVALAYHLLNFRSATPTELADALKLLTDNDQQALLAAYPPASPTNADEALSAVFTQGIFSCPALFATQAAASNAGQAVYQYEFADPNPQGADLDPLMPLGDFHGSELTYLFSKAQGLPTPTLTAAQQSLSDQMIKYWTTFAKTGNPNTPGTPTWPAFTTGSQQVQELTSQGTAPSTTFAADHHCQLWK